MIESNSKPILPLMSKSGDRSRMGISGDAGEAPRCDGEPEVHAWRSRSPRMASMVCRGVLVDMGFAARHSGPSMMPWNILPGYRLDCIL